MTFYHNFKNSKEVKIIIIGDLSEAPVILENYERVYSVVAFLKFTIAKQLREKTSTTAQ